MEQERELELLNEKLDLVYGHSLTGRPWFRVVYSDGEIEKRKGDFDVFGENDIWLRREVDTVREVLKYPHLRNRFVLERYVKEPFGKWPLVPIPDYIFNWTGYEPFYAFTYVEARPVPPFEACHFIIQTNVFHKDVMSLSKMWDAKEEERKKLLDRSMQILDEISPYMVGLMEDGEAIVVPRNYGDDNGSNRS